MTIPSVLNHYREQEVVSKVKKFYSTFSQVIQLAILENGTVDNWDISPQSGVYDAVSAAKFMEYIRPYLNIMTDCGTGEGECMGTTPYIKLNGVTHGNWGKSSQHYKILLQDGSLVWFKTYPCIENSETLEPEECALFYYDINGDTQPNTVGKDVFLLEVTPTGTEAPPIDDCYLDSYGWGCINYVIQHGNLNYPDTK